MKENPQEKTDRLRDCDEIRSLLFEYLNRELGPGRSDLVREHLRKCKECQAEAAGIQGTFDLLKKASQAKTDVPDHLSEDHRRRIKWSIMHPVLAWISAHHMVVSALAAVVLVVALMLMLLTQIPEEPPPAERIIPLLLVPDPDGGTNYYIRVLTTTNRHSTILNKRPHRKLPPLLQPAEKRQVMKSQPPSAEPDGKKVENPKEKPTFPDVKAE